MNFKKYLLGLFIFINITLMGNEIIYFNGGKQLLGLNFQSRFLSDTDVGNLSFGNTNTSSLLTANQFRANPATLGYFSNSAISIDVNPGFALNGTTVADMVLGDGEFNKILNEGLVEGLKGSEMAGDIFDPSNPNEFNDQNFGLDFTPLASHKSSLNGFSAVFSPPIGYIGEYGQIGLSHRSLIDFELELLTGGVALTIEQSDTASTIPTVVKLPLAIDMGLDLGIYFNETDFGYGIDLGQFLFDSENKLTVGVGLNYLNGRIYNNTVLTINGMIRQIGEQDITAFFNDPSSSYRNTLNDSVLIDFKGNSIRPTFGISFNKNAFYADFSFVGQSEMIMNGNLDITTHTMGALKLSPNDADLYDDLNSNGVWEDGEPIITDHNNNGEWDEKEELFDMFLLKPSALTFTNRTKYVSNTLNFKYPGKIALSFSFMGRFIKSVVGYEKSLGEFSVLYECDIFDDGQRKVGNEFLTYCPEDGECDIQSQINSKSYQIIAIPNHTGKFGIGIGKFFMGGSVLIGDLEFDGILDSEDKPIEKITGVPLGGTFGMGFRVPMTSRLMIDISLLSSPGLAGFSTITYSF